MTTKYPITGLAVLALAGGFAIRATREASHNRAVIAMLAEQSDGVRAATASVEQRLRTARAALAKREPKDGQLPGGSNANTSDGAGGSATASGSDTAAKPDAPIARPTATSIITSDPQKHSAYLQGFRGFLEFEYGGMFKALALSADEIEKWKDLQVERRQLLLDLDAAAVQQGLDRSSAGYRKLREDHFKSLEAKEAALLGDRFAPRNEYSRSDTVRRLAAELAGSAIYSGLPVTCSQVEQTAQILAANSQRYPSSVGPGYVKPNTVNWPAARAQLQDVLSPSQIEILGSIIQRVATKAKVDELEKRLTAEFKARMPTP